MPPKPPAARYAIHKECAYPLPRRHLFDELMIIWDLGFIAGLLRSWLILPVCRRLNGAPPEAAEQGLILSGDLSGTATSIYEFAIDQGCQPGR